MSTGVKVRKNTVTKTARSRPAAPGRPGVRRDRSSRFAPPATQRVGQRRPTGVRGPRLANPAQFDTRRPASVVPPAMVGAGMRLTDRGLAVAMAVTIALVIAAVVCIATTAARVTAEPAPGDVIAASVAR